MLTIRKWMNTLYELRWYIFIAAALFIGGFVIGHSSSGLHTFLQQQLLEVKKMAEELKQAENTELAFFVTIFYNNALKAIFIMFAGLLFGLIPIAFLVLNGMILGFLIHIMSIQGFDVAESVIKGLLPHGILEIPAIIIAAAYGMKLGAVLLRRLFNRSSSRKIVSLTEWLKRTGAGAVWITVILLVAAIIESTITFWLMSSM
ncbi:stage II sporulation protein M [Paenibacillus sp. 481]|uniref:stage II sporulation protein M n=1 Tax=Paenibacillus sp. 481 TaxID=2835869 RepID=UPI001E2E04EE|nr:stage II sporulation protein M [Paenibacillus sp. 481]UHA71743.1 stage II sporulation protein M [Paenibacillus sp. 481]